MDYPSVTSIKSFYFQTNPCLIDKWNHDLLATGELAQLYRNGTPPSELNGYISYNSSKKTFKILKSFLWPYSYTTGTDNYFALNEGEIFNGNGHYITFGEHGNAYNVGIFSSNLNNSNITDDTILPLILNLTIKSYVNDSGAGFMRSGENNYKIVNCHHKGNIISSVSGGISTSPYLSYGQNS